MEKEKVAKTKNIYEAVMRDMANLTDEIRVFDPADGV